jgi:hypothetical protein
MKQEVESLKFINETLISFSNCQVDIIKALKKNCYSNRLFYNIIKESQIFEKLNKVNLNLKNDFESEFPQYEREDSLKTSNNEEICNFEDNIFNYDVNVYQIKKKRYKSMII